MILMMNAKKYMNKVILEKYLTQLGLRYLVKERTRQNVPATHSRGKTRLTEYVPQKTSTAMQ